MRIIQLTNKDTGEVKNFSSLAPLFRQYPELESKRSNIENYLSRKKKPYNTDEIKIERVTIFT